MSPEIESISVDVEYAVHQLRDHKCIRRALDALDRVLDTIHEAERVTHRPAMTAEDMLDKLIADHDRETAGSKGGDA